MQSRAYDGEITAGRYDDSRLFEGVRTRRIFAFLIDYLIVLLLMIPFGFLVAVLGVLTLGLGWMLFGVLFPAVALTYVWMTLGGRSQATKGMQAMSIRLERLDGGPIDGMLALVHTVLFWAGNVLLTPVVLLATLVLDHKRTVHDLLLGTVVCAPTASRCPIFKKIRRRGRGGKCFPVDVFHGTAKGNAIRGPMITAR